MVYVVVAVVSFVLGWMAADTYAARAAAALKAAEESAKSDILSATDKVESEVKKI